MWERQREIAAPVMSSEDAREGASAFKEKREPVWRGR
jgi:enoyl-CoA hydratase